MVRGLDDNYHKVPNDIGVILKTPYEHSVLDYLLRCADDNNQCFPSYAKITQGLMTRRCCMNVCKELENKGYIKIKERKFKSNIFTVNIGKIVNDIHKVIKNTSEPDSLPSKPKYSERQKDIMAEKRATTNPAIAHRAEFKNGFDVSKDGKIINNDIVKLNHSIKYNKS